MLNGATPTGPMTNANVTTLGALTMTASGATAGKGIVVDSSTNITGVGTVTMNALVASGASATFGTLPMPSNDQVISYGNNCGINSSGSLQDSGSTSFIAYTLNGTNGNVLLSAKQGTTIASGSTFTAGGSATLTATAGAINIQTVNPVTSGTTMQLTGANGVTIVAGEQLTAGGTMGLHLQGRQVRQ